MVRARDGAAKVPVSSTISQDEYARLTAVAKLEKRSLAQTVRCAIEDYVNKRDPQQPQLVLRRGGK